MRRVSFRQYLILLSSRWRVLSFLNLIFFGVTLGTALLASIIFAPPLSSGQKVFVFPSFIPNNFFLLFLFIFTFNLAISAFTVVTLPGLLFFPLSTVALVYRGLLWGLLLCLLPPASFLILLPVVVLEGEAYVFAALAGALTGFSWVKPEKGSGRLEAFKKALGQCLQAYVLVAVLLFVAAAAETAVIILMPT